MATTADLVDDRIAVIRPDTGDVTDVGKEGVT